MHTYPKYHAPSGRHSVELVRNFPFAVAATSQPVAAPIATHIPVIFDPSSSPTETLVGQRMLGHMGRANPHWELFAEHPDILLVFSTSQGYISPATYQRDPAVPTTDYAAVHLTGRVTLLDDAAALDVVKSTVLALEKARDPQWDMSDSLILFEKIIGRVVAFTIDINTEQAMFKLSQDMPDDIRLRIRDDLLDRDCPHADLTTLMNTLSEEKLRP
ncbi:FMN-binding negative transcriptional regulator [Rhodococcus qingshengii]|uniref:FMN-binding negative transcriptional regulator n=1 Tax=Rhodococcus qingshengii TaxID=334542 RepID=UPI0036DCEDA9